MSFFQETPADARRRAGLRRMRMVATGLLVLAAIVYVLTLRLDHDGVWGYVNTAAEAGCALAAARAVGLDARPAPRPAFTSEDFSFMLQKRPGAYLWLGQGRGDPHAVGEAPLHHPCYEFNDAALPLGIRWFCEVAERALEQDKATERSAGHECIEADRQPADVDRVEAVDIFRRVDARQDCLLVDMLRKGQLNENAVDRVVGVEAIDQRDQVVLRSLGGNAVLEALHARLERRLDL